MFGVRRTANRASGFCDLGGMRIAQVSPLTESVPPQLYGGTERIVSYLTEELVRQGHNVTLFASGDSRTAAHLHATTPTALRLTASVHDPVAYAVLQLEEVRRQASEFDLVHFHGEYLHFPLIRAMGLTNCVTTTHGRLDLRDHRRLYDEFRDLSLVSISDHQRQPLAQCNWVGTVHHGLPPDLCPFVPDKPHGDDYVAFLGRISPEKRADRAIEIARLAGVNAQDRRQGGQGGCRVLPFADRAAAGPDHVEFVGEIGDSEKADFLGRARALLFPIDWPEPFGLVDDRSDVLRHALRGVARRFRP